MAVRPIDERVVVRALGGEQVVGGIIIPDTGAQRPQLGEVLAVGDDVDRARDDRRPLSQVVHVGDRVVFAQYGATDVTVEGEEVLVLDRADILGVIIDD